MIKTFDRHRNTFFRFPEFSGAYGLYRHRPALNRGLSCRVKLLARELAPPRQEFDVVAANVSDGAALGRFERSMTFSLIRGSRSRDSAHPQSAPERIKFSGVFLRDFYRHCRRCRSSPRIRLRQKRAARLTNDPAHEAGKRYTCAAVIEPMLFPGGESVFQKRCHMAPRPRRLHGNRQFCFTDHMESDLKFMCVAG